LHAVVGNPAVTVFPPGDYDGPTVIDSTDGRPVPYIIPPPLIGGGDTPYDTKVQELRMCVRWMLNEARVCKRRK
jgi:hypothetical protein